MQPKTTTALCKALRRVMNMGQNIKSVVSAWVVAFK
jgi:hypothetical protein